MDKKWETLRKLEDKVQNQVMGVPDRKHRIWRGNITKQIKQKIYVIIGGYKSG